ncbi:MAG TPA: c-type cytochrome [Xanthomonadales bacterium]|nr:c-type cytochrome [Xanthomonadales bacterium]
MRKFLLMVPALLALAACSDEQTSQVPAGDIETGKTMAAEHCSGCHGLDGRGLATDIPDLAGQKTEYLADALTAYKDGRRHHAALRDLVSEMDETTIASLALYYSSLPPLEAGTSQVTQSVTGSSYHEGKAIAEICTDCHGDNGYSETPGTPSLAGQQPAYLIVSTLEYVNGSRGHAEKEAMLQGLQQVDIEKMSFYFAAQSPPVRGQAPFGDPARGEPLSAACGECHGARGISHEPLVPSLAGQEPNYLADAIRAYRDHGRDHDVMMTDRTDAEIEDIAAFYAVQSAEPAVSRLAEVEKLAAKCDRCHASTTGTLSIAVPSLRGQNQEYLVNAMKAYRDENRGSSMMHKMSASYSDETIEALAAYYSSDSGQN